MQAHNFLSILLHFTITYALGIIDIYYMGLL